MRGLNKALHRGFFRNRASREWHVLSVFTGKSLCGACMPTRELYKGDVWVKQVCHRCMVALDRQEESILEEAV